MVLTWLLGLLLLGTRLGRVKLLTVQFYFCMVNVAALQATVNIIRGNRILLWEPQRDGTVPKGKWPTPESDAALTKQGTSPAG